VLARFAPDEKEAVEIMIERAARCVEMAVTEGFEQAMAGFNAAEGPGESR
jgi:peptidyl-tRNA hydrolase